jgi:hypothetical protein
MTGRTFLSAFIAAGIFTTACSKENKTMVEASPSPMSVQAKQQQLQKLPPPELVQVQAALKRVFKNSVALDSGDQAAFLVGDFNGDLSQDIAVVVRPSPGKVADLNERDPSWLLRDVSHTTEPGGPQLQVADNEVLLAIIHGFGAEGWRDSQATQTYLLKDAVGSSLTVQPGKEFTAANAGKALPRIHGDLLSEVRHGASGYLYYNGPTYSWYDPKTFKADTEVRVVHGRVPAMKPR